MTDEGYPIASGTVTVSGETIALGVTADRAPFGARERAAVAEWLRDLAANMDERYAEPVPYGPYTVSAALDREEARKG